MFIPSENQLAFLRNISNDHICLEIARQAIEDNLIELRDARISLLNRGNGLVIKEYDGKDSHIIRMGPETALSIGLKAILSHLEKGNKLDD